MNLKENWSRSKEVFGAYFRQGLHELGSVFHGRNTNAQSPEYGMIATKTPGQVAEGLRGAPHANDRSDTPARSALDLQLESARDRGDYTPEMQMDARDLERE